MMWILSVHAFLSEAVLIKKKRISTQGWEIYIGTAVYIWDLLKGCD